MTSTMQGMLADTPVLVPDKAKPKTTLYAVCPFILHTHNHKHKETQIPTKNTNANIHMISTYKNVHNAYNQISKQ